MRVALSYYVANGMSAALGILLISAGVLLFAGAFAAAAASVGVIVVTPPDQPAPRRGKFWQLLPAALLGPPLFFVIQLLHATPLYLGLLLVPATFVAFLGAAWGKRGLPIAIAVMLAMLFSMAVPPEEALVNAVSSSLYFALGAALYLMYATLANAALNPRYRVQMLADTLLSLAQLMRTQACQFTPADGQGDGKAPLIGQLLRQQAALADQLQTARDMLLEAPRTVRRQRLAGMLMQVLDMRDHLLVCELDLDALKSHPGHALALGALREVLEDLAGQIEQLADALLLGRQPLLFDSHRPRLGALEWAEDAPAATAPAMLARGLASRVGYIDDEALRLIALARGEAEPDLVVVRAAWQMFVSPTTWSWRPFAGLWRWDAPPLRHAIRAALAMATGYAIALAVPWGTHAYWILLTIVVVLRGSVAQTVQRRNSRVAGTVLGCLLAGALLSAPAPPLLLLACVTLAQGVAHAFAIRRYLVTAVAASVLGLLQAHLLHAGSSPGFAMLERIGDTLIGVAIAWAFSYVLPSWERTRIPSLVARSLAAQARHARLALGLGQLRAGDNAPELEWRLARREAHDSLSALVQATQQSLAEPRAVRPPLEALGRLLARSYQLLAHLTSVKSMLLLRRDRLDAGQIGAPLLQAASAIDAALTGNASVAPFQGGAASNPLALPDPFESDLNPWLLRRIDLAAALAVQLRDDADAVLGPAAA